jgi:hypothetical protein
MEFIIKDKFKMEKHKVKDYCSMRLKGIVIKEIGKMINLTEKENKPLKEFHNI